MLSWIEEYVNNQKYLYEVNYEIQVLFFFPKYGKKKILYYTIAEVLYITQISLVFGSIVFKF